MHKPIFIKDLGLSFTNKTCFEHFSTQIYLGSRIAIIGRNGSGKSSLLNIIRGTAVPSSGKVMIPEGVSIGYVEQTIDDFADLSGGQRFNKRLSEVLAQSPDLLLLDEPTNHLDRHNRTSLLQMLKRYQGTLIVVTHDTELLRHCVAMLWHIDNHTVTVFAGSYDDYMNEIRQKRASIEKELTALKRATKDTHKSLMQEQKRAAKSRAKGQKSIEQKKWPTVVSTAKALRAEQTSGKKKAAIESTKQQLTEQLSDLRLADVIVPTFSLSAVQTGSGNLLSIENGTVGYSSSTPVVRAINLSLHTKERIALCGNNGSGKSTLLKAIMGTPGIVTTGSWHLPSKEFIGYLDQHYSNLKSTHSVMDHVQAVCPDWSDADVRRHLNDFLFRKNEEVTQKVAHLSGGEKARASLSLIAAQTPRLLILDEITNNLDLETKEHVIQVLKEYPGAMIIVSHDEDFLDALNVDHRYTIVDGEFRF